MNAAKLTDIISVTCPIYGVSMGRADDKATWRIDFKDEATSDQRSAALATLAAINPETEAARAAILSQLAEIDRAAGAVRWIREFALGTNDGFNAVRAALLPSLPTAGSGMNTLASVEKMAIALRSQLAAIA